MDNSYESHNGNNFEAETLFDNDPYEFIEEESGFAEDADFDERRRRPHPGRHRASHRRIMMAIRRLASRIQRIQMQLRRMSQETGTPVNVYKRLKQMEQQVEGFQQNQLMSYVLNLPQLSSIQFEDENPRNVESSAYSKDSLLLLQLLNQQDSTSGMQGNLSDCLLPLLLLNDDDQKGGLGKDPLTLMLLMSMMNKNK